LQKVCKPALRHSHAATYSPPDEAVDSERTVHPENNNKNISSTNPVDRVLIRHPQSFFIKKITRVKKIPTKYFVTIKWNTCLILAIY
jgi:hypothetical protein